jgi:hypothetical protein
LGIIGADSLLMLKFLSRTRFYGAVDQYDQKHKIEEIKQSPHLFKGNARQRPLCKRRYLLGSVLIRVSSAMNGSLLLGSEALPSIRRRFFDMIHDERGYGTCCRFQFESELVLYGFRGSLPRTLRLGIGWQCPLGERCNFAIEIKCSPKTSSVNLRPIP